MKNLHFKDMDLCVREVCTKICPQLCNIIITYSDKTRCLIDINFYFHDDPRNDEIGYLGHCYEEFTQYSQTWEQLLCITYIIKHYFNFKYDDTDW